MKNLTNNNYLETHSEKDILIINFKEKGLKIFNTSRINTLLSVIKEGFTDNNIKYILLSKENADFDYNKNKEQIESLKKTNTYIDSLELDAIYNWI